MAAEGLCERSASLAALAERAGSCRLCRDAPAGAPLPVEPRPILVLSATARLMIASQAPGHRAYRSGVPFDDPSGVRLRHWMGLEPAQFYDPDRVMILPMGFCFPGHDAAGGDLPPRPECRRAWHGAILPALPQLELILAVGLHAIRYHLARLHPGTRLGRGLGEHVLHWRDTLALGTRPALLPLPHPSWRNTAWLRRNPVFERELLPLLRQEVARLAG